jgi:hypothetical protein
VLQCSHYVGPNPAVSRTKIQQQNYYYHWVDASAGGLLVTDGIIRPVVSALNLNLFVLNATFSNISAISWRPVLVMEEAGVPGENHRPWASNW